MQDSQHRIQPRCPHFGACGGCQTQDIAYGQQLRDKGTALQELFGFCWPGPVPVEGSPDIWHYRNKVDPNFGGKHYDEPPPKGFQRETALGFKPRGRWYGPLEIDECHIAPNGFPELLGAVRGWLRERGYQAFHSRSETGFLRVLLVRDAKHTGQRMVVLVTADGELDVQGFLECVQSVFPSDSIQHALFRGKAQVAAADELRLLHGVPGITEELHIPDEEASSARKLSFRISPFSFFQTNTLAAERLYGKIRAWVKQTAATTLYDLYGGMGSIALACADLVEQVYSVENVPEASEDGRHNAQLNGIDNVTFHTERVEDYLHEFLLKQEALPESAAVVVDPPRAGLHPKALRRLLDLSPPRILYVSCKPTVLAGEIEALLEKYTVVDMKAVDMFPHTRHVELVAQFERR
ncbi:MAG TPA: 23S rRNA (uracil(1939)-C(5))-methyltransferase RlmD [Candidatus Hydrogenedentes bacterium]|nr:23S rRNA (uracil(1939)-C(5))-methyltransferase RlmD [Candidatus Hydrogenedentota bacterium]HQM49586.1 23S rRNA (uracil(1939)-C(5))-methyltransferase RlmD [Candidatus Hydrogenedentota bacterium]